MPIKNKNNEIFAKFSNFFDNLNKKTLKDDIVAEFKTLNLNSGIGAAFELMRIIEDFERYEKLDQTEIENMITDVKSYFDTKNKEAKNLQNDLETIDQE